MILVKTLSRSEASNLKESLYREIISQIIAVKYITLFIQRGDKKHIGLGFPRIGLGQKIEK